MKVVGWLAVCIALVSALVGVSPAIIGLLDEQFIEGGWALLLFSIPVGAIGLFIAGVLATVTCAIGLARGAKLPGLLGIIGIATSIAGTLIGYLFVLTEPEPRVVIVAAVVAMAVLGYLAALVGSVWSGFATKPAIKVEA